MRDGKKVEGDRHHLIWAWVEAWVDSLEYSKNSFL